MKTIYFCGMTLTGFLAIYGGAFNGLHEKEFKHISLNLLAALSMLCIVFWPATWTAAIVIYLMETKR